MQKKNPHLYKYTTPPDWIFPLTCNHIDLISVH